MGYIKQPRAKWTPGHRLGQVSTRRLEEFVEPLKFFLVGTAWTVADLIGHGFFEATAGEKTPAGYYGSKLLYSVPALIAGRLLSNQVGGSQFARALTIGTTANALMQLRYLGILGGEPFPRDFNIAVFLLHEALLVPLSFLITGKE